MFPGRYFPNRYFAPRYFAKVGAVASALVSMFVQAVALYVSGSRKGQVPTDPGEVHVSGNEKGQVR